MGIAEFTPGKPRGMLDCAAAGLRPGVLSAAASLVEMATFCEYLLSAMTKAR